MKHTKPPRSGRSPEGTPKKAIAPTKSATKVPSDLMAGVIGELADKLGIDNGNPLDVLKSAINALARVNEEDEHVANTVRDFLELGHDADHTLVEERLRSWAGEIRTARASDQSRRDRVAADRPAVPARPSRPLSPFQVIPLPRMATGGR